MSRGISFKLVLCAVCTYIFIFVGISIGYLTEGREGRRKGKVMKYKSQGIKIFTG